MMLVRSIIFTSLLFLLTEARPSRTLQRNINNNNTLAKEGTRTRSPTGQPRNDDDLIAPTPFFLSPRLRRPTSIPSIQPSDMPSSMPSDAPSTAPSSMPSRMPSPTGSTAPSHLSSEIDIDEKENDTGAVKLYYGSSVYDRMDQVVFTCGGVPMDSMNASSAPTAFLVPYSYSLLFDADTIQRHNNPIELIQHTIDTMQALILDTVLYSACSIRPFLYSDQDAIALATTERDRPLTDCGDFCLVVEGSITSFLSDAHGLIGCNAKQAIHNLLSSERIAGMEGVLSAAPEGVSLDSLPLCLPVTVDAAMNSEPVPIVDDYSVNKYYTCQGQEATADEDTLSRVEYDYELIVSEDSEDLDKVVRDVERMLFYSALESACYTAAAVQKQSMLVVSAAPSDSVIQTCGKNCFSIRGVLGYLYSDLYGHVECAIIDALFNAFQGDTMANSPKVSNATFRSEDLFSSCSQNDLSLDPQYEPSAAFNGTESNSKFEENFEYSHIGEQTFAIALGAGIGFITTMAAMAILIRRGRRREQARPVPQTEEIRLEPMIPMEPEDECTPRKLFVGDHEDDWNSPCDHPAIYYSDLKTDFDHRKPLSPISNIDDETLP